MAIKDLLVHIDNSRACAKRLETAIQIAQDHDAHLLGLYVMPRFAYYAYAEVVSAQRALDQARQETQQARRRQAEVARARFDAAIERAGRSAASEWRSVEAELTTQLSASAYGADLVILGQHDEADPADVSHALADRLVLSIGRPCLVIPYIGAQHTLGQRVLVAWDASREAVRAVNDALPILQGAEHVEVLTATPSHGESSAEDMSSADICRHLARHGVRAESHLTRAADVDVGDLLLSHAADMRADLMVMGAYGHSRLRETVLGGVTRHMLHHMTIPVLMSH